jgi:hypothetical protein
VGSFVTHNFAFALLAAIFLGFNPASLGILAWRCRPGWS